MIFYSTPVFVNIALSIASINRHSYPDFLDHSSKTIITTQNFIKACPQNQKALKPPTPTTPTLTTKLHIHTTTKNHLSFARPLGFQR